MVKRYESFLAVIGALAMLGCTENEASPPSDYASFYEVASRQWVTKVVGIKPEETTKIRELVEQVGGVTPGSVLVGKDYVAFWTEAKPSDRLEHSRIGAEVSAALKKQPALRVGDSTTGPQP